MISNSEELQNAIIAISERFSTDDEILTQLREVQEYANGNGISSADITADDGKTWKEKFETLDKAYREAFFGGNSSAQGNVEPAANETELHIDDLFN